MRSAVRSAFVAILLGLTACGASSAEGPADSLPFPENPTTTQPSTTTTESSLATLTSVEIPEFRITAEMLEGMLSTEEGRTLIVQGLTDQTGMSLEDADCFLDALSLETMVGLSILQSPEAELDLNAEQEEELTSALEECELSFEALRP